MKTTEWCREQLLTKKFNLLLKSNGQKFKGYSNKANRNLFPSTETENGYINTTFSIIKAKGTREMENKTQQREQNILIKPDEAR